MIAFHIIRKEPSCVSVAVGGTSIQDYSGGEERQGQGEAEILKMHRLIGARL